RLRLLWLPGFGTHAALQLQTRASLDSVPQGFVPNVGQLRNDAVKFTLRHHGVTAHFTDRGFVLGNGQSVPVSHDGMGWESPVAPRWELVGARPTEPVGAEALQHTVSFFRGDDPARWRANVPAYRSLRYPEILGGVELHVEERPHGFEYTFRVRPHAKPELRFRYEGITALEQSGNGNLVVRTAKGYFTESRPVSFQVIEGVRREVESAFEVVSATEYRITVGPYDERHALVIDPVLDWSSFWGGTQSENSKTVRVAPDGSIVVAGNSVSTDLPESPAGFGTGAGVNTAGGAWYRDAYVARFTRDGTQLLWSGYLGGNGATDEELGWKGLAVNASGDVYVSGFTTSPDFPVTLSTPHAGAVDAFITKIKADGSQILWSRLLGGGDADWSSGLALDPAGDLFIAGYTRSTDLPVTPSFDATLGGAQDAFVAKLAGASGVTQWVSYLGGSAEERVVGVAATPDGDAVVVGDTASSDFPVASAFQPVFGGINDAFVTKIAGNGAGLVWSTFLGGSDKEHDRVVNLADPFPASWAKGDVALDSAGNVLVVGQTHSPNFPVTPGAYQTTRRGGSDGYVTKLAPNGSLLWSSFLGGSGPADPDGREEIAWGVSVNPWDEVLVVGWTQSTDFPTTTGALKTVQSNSSRYDGFLSKLGANGSQLLYSTYLGGSENNDVALGVTCDPLVGRVLVTGWATAASFPTTAGAYQTGCISCLTPDLWAADGYVMSFLDASVAHDGFESGAYSGGSGDWSGGWAASGDASIQTASGPHSGSRHARLRRGTGLLSRTVLVPPGSTSLQMGFWSKLSSFEGADHAVVRVTPAGGGTTTLITFTASDSDNVYRYREFDLGSMISASSLQITFDANMSGTDDQWFLDDIRVTGTSLPPPPPSNPLHGGDLDGSSANSGKNSWKATVVVTLHDGNEQPIPGATVSVAWGGGAGGAANAVTDANGRCTFVSGNISKSSSSATLTITGASHPTLTYSAAANHDPDGDSNGTSITVSKP
ncbi:MAG: SBBP repeat-containing protein, partial [Verrucomicrobia bacterium]|nr:SBBP repeat-containing protein [Verrucomicrobiota bacterium]